MPKSGLVADLRSDFDGTANLTVTEPTPEGRTTFALTSGLIDQDAESFFGRGYCHWLAGAIHSLTGWDLVTVDTHTGDGDWQPVHTAVVTPRGVLLDIFGQHSLDGMRRRYTRTEDEHARLRTVANADMPGDVITGIDEYRGDPLWWAHKFGAPSQPVLLHFARLLLRKWGHGHHIRPSGMERPAPDSEHHATAPAPTTSTPATGGKDTTMSLQELVGQLSALGDRIPTGLLEQAAGTEMPDSAQAADLQLQALLGEVQGLLDGVGYAGEISGALDHARASLEQAAQSYQQVKMYLGDARDAAARAQEYVTKAVAHHLR